MSYRLMFTINALLALAFGLFFLVLPFTALKFFGVGDAYVSTLAVFRFLGGALTSVGVVLWLMRDSNSETAKSKAVALIALAFGGVVLIVWQLISPETVLRRNGWIPLTTFILLTVGYAYLIFGVSIQVKNNKTESQQFNQT